jgi:hypothetical protein
VWRVVPGEIFCQRVNAPASGEDFSFGRNDNMGKATISWLSTQFDFTSNVSGIFPKNYPNSTKYHKQNF